MNAKPLKKLNINKQANCQPSDSNYYYFNPTSQYATIFQDKDITSMPATQFVVHLSIFTRLCGASDFEHYVHNLLDISVQL